MMYFYPCTLCFNILFEAFNLQMTKYFFLFLFLIVLYLFGFLFPVRASVRYLMSSFNKKFPWNLSFCFLYCCLLLTDSLPCISHEPCATTFHLFNEKEWLLNPSFCTLLCSSILYKMYSVKPLYTVFQPFLKKLITTFKKEHSFYVPHTNN